MIDADWRQISSILAKAMNMASTEQLQIIRNGFRARGLTITDWAKENGFSRNVVYAVLQGRVLCYRGEAHRVAVALGIKEGGSTA